jgi:hypothetical protein
LLSSLKETKSLRELWRNSARRALSWYRCAQKELLLEFRKDKKCQRDLLRVAEHPVGLARSA